jgi:hypothetical protein
MTSRKSILKAIVLPAAAALMMSTASGQAAVIGSYVLDVEGRLSSVDFGSAYRVNNNNNRVRHVQNASYRNPNRPSINSDAAWVAELGARSGSMQIDIHDTGDVSYTGCSGFLSTMCNGAYQAASGASLTASDGYSFLAELSTNGFSYSDDGTYSWDRGHRSFFQDSYGVSVNYDISASSLSAVPLPASLAFLMGGFGLLLGFRKRANA